MNRVILSMLVGFLALVTGASAWAQPEIKAATYTITEVKQYNVQVVRINGQSLTVDVEGVGRRRFHMPRGFTFDIDGETKTLNQILPGQKLRAYVTETETGELLLVQDDEATEGVVGETVTAADDALAEAQAAEAQAAEAQAAEAQAAEAQAAEAQAAEAQAAEAATAEDASEETPEQDVLSGASFESPPTALPATADNRGWIAILGGALLLAGLGVGWLRRRENGRTN